MNSIENLYENEKIEEMDSRFRGNDKQGRNNIEDGNDKIIGIIDGNTGFPFSPLSRGWE